MTLRIRKLIVLLLVAALFLVANLMLVVSWLQEKGVIDWAKDARKEYVTGTAITIIVVLLILLVAPRGEGRGLFRRCPANRSFPSLPKPFAKQELRPNTSSATKARSSGANGSSDGASAARSARVSAPSASMAAPPSSSDSSGP